MTQPYYPDVAVVADLYGAQIVAPYGRLFVESHELALLVSKLLTLLTPEELNTIRESCTTAQHNAEVCHG